MNEWMNDDSFAGALEGREMLSNVKLVELKFACLDVS